MKTYTYGDLKTQVERELDLFGEDFVTAEEMLGYANDAITEAEAEIHRLEIEDQYFLTKLDIAPPAGTTTIDFPADIYAQKIVSIVAHEADRHVKVKQYHRTSRVDRFERIANAYTSDDYQFLIMNGVKPQIMLVPAVRPNTTFTIWYIRSAARVTDDSSPIEIPEFDLYMTALMKAKCRAKENLGQIPADAAAEVQAARRLMLDTLSNRISEEPDYDSYFDHYINHA